MNQLHHSSANAAPPPNRSTDADVARWLASGGDERIGLNGLGRNRYGCGAAPEPDAAGFSSSTASTISAGAFEAARRRLGTLLAEASPRDAYAAGVADVRRRLAGLCGLAPGLADNVVLAASGTDLHLIAADLARGERSRRLVSVMADPRETGRGVANALCDRRYATASPHGPTAVEGDPLDGAHSAQLLAIPLREDDGAVRDAEAVDAAFEAAVDKAMATGGGVLLVLLDVSKTGLVAPSPGCAVRLKRRHGAALTVMVDACQFRLSPESLGDYLGEGFLVAVTGSKFVGGPPFSGALILPPRHLDLFQRIPIAAKLGDYCARADWPGAFVSRSVLPDVQNFGLLLRWEAALHELEAFRCIPVDRLNATLHRVATVAQTSLSSASFEALAAPPQRRFGRDSWDAAPTLFAFLVRGAHSLLNAAQAQALYLALADDRILLGQPVPVGRRGGQPISALRLAISARQLTRAAATSHAADELAREIRDTLDIVAARATALC